jgi:hypothetical protein
LALSPEGVILPDAFFWSEHSCPQRDGSYSRIDL